MAKNAMVIIQLGNPWVISPIYHSSKKYVIRKTPALPESTRLNITYGEWGTARWDIENSIHIMTADWKQSVTSKLMIRSVLQMFD